MTDRFRARDLLLLPGLLSLSRAAFALAFPFVVDRPLAACAVLVAAGLSDVLDGFFARRLKQVTPTGVVLDGITDKLFALTVAITLLACGRFSLLEVLLLSTRELGELPLVVRHLLSARSRRTRAEQPAANVFGKLATVLQFIAIATVLLGAPYAQGWIGAAATGGACAAISYWRRAQPGERRRG